MRPPLFKTALVLLAMTTGSVFAKEVEVKSKVSHVTVFPSGAQIIRNAKIDLQAGDQTIVIRGLPQRLITRSLRVEGVGDKSFEIGAVDAKSILVDVIGKDGVLDKTQRRALEKEIERLNDDNARLASRIRAAETQRRLIERLAELPGQPPVRPYEGRAPGSDDGGGSNALFSVNNWGRIFDLIGARMAVADDLILKYRQELRETNRQIARLKKRLALQPAKKERQMEVRIAIASQAAMKGGLKIKYQVREASWRPFYDARLSTGEKGAKPGLVLARRAGIRQWSGEDWTNIKLSLSTTSPQKGAKAPVLHPKRLDLRAEHPVATSMASGYADRARGMVRKEMTEDLMATAEAPPAPAPRVLQLKKPRRIRAVERRARVRQYAFQAVFEIPGEITIKPTGDEKKVAISSDRLVSTLNVKTVPKLDATAYLYAKFTHDAKSTPLLPGAVALYRDGTFTGNGSLPLVNAGEEHALGFGADDAVKVTRAEIRRTKGEAGVFTSSKTDEQRYHIKVINRHTTPVDVEVIDQIPYSVNEKIVVRLLPSSTPPTRQNIKDRRGILAWDFKLDGGKENLIKLDYTVTWPADKKLTR